MAKILSSLGYVNSNIHIHGSLAQIWRFTGDAKYDREHQPGEFAEGCPDPAALLNSFSEHEFAVGHIPKSDKSVSLLSGHKKIILFRDLAGCLLSMYRWRMISGRAYNMAYSRSELGAYGFGVYLQSDGVDDARRWYEMFNWSETDGIIVWFDDLRRGDLDYATWKVMLDLPHNRDEFNAAIAAGIASDTQTKIAPTEGVVFWDERNIDMFTKLKHQ